MTMPKFEPVGYQDANGDYHYTNTSRGDIVALHTADQLTEAYEAGKRDAIPESYVLVPKEPNEDQWGGLARGIMMWLYFDNPTPRKLFEHLRRLGAEIPSCLTDEPEMQNLDHVPSKGTKCVIVYLAMPAATPKELK